jgi:RNA polymerase sigma factor (sigma-70 family)
MYPSKAEIVVNRQSSNEFLPTDEQLFARFRDLGDDHAFDLLYQRYSPILHRFLSTKFSNESLIEEAIQVTFLKVFRNADQFVDSCKLKPWLYAVARNSAGDLLRRYRRHQIQSLNESHADLGEFAKKIDPEDCRNSTAAQISEFKETCDEIRKAVQYLPEKSRCVVELVYFEGFRFAEAAEKLSVPLGTVKSRINCSLKTLRELLPSRTLT